jgi:hypothetical protein
VNPFPLGWIPFAARTAQMDALHAAALATMPNQFRLAGAAPDPGPKVYLKNLWTEKDVVAAIGFAFPGVHQITGSCVGAGFANVCFTLGSYEVLRQNDAEQIVLPFWLYDYGISRMLIGETTEGEGSLGSAIAEAARTYGVIDQREPGLPVPQNSDGLVWGQQTEMTWSNGKRIASSWVQLGKKHLIKTTAPCKSAADVRTAIRNGYPVTMAIDDFVNPGTERQQGTGENAAVIGAPNANGGHQTSILAVWDNPELGPLFWYQNQWGLRVYKQDPSTGWADGVWMTEKTVDQWCRGRDSEFFAYSQFDGFPAQYVMLGEGSILPKA